MVTGMDLSKPINRDPPCEACMRGKMKRASHTGHLLRGRFKLDIIHSDVTGPYPTRGYRGELYVVSFIDDFTSYSEVHFIKYKSEVFTLFQQFKLKNETATLRIHYYHTDNGGEYVDKESEAILATQGITHHRTTPLQP